VNASIVYVFIIIFIVLAINIFFVAFRSAGGSRYRKRYKVAVDEAKQALWRDNEIERRLEREQEGALERVKLRNETLALYDEVRRRAALRESEGTLLTSKQWTDMESLESDDIERFR